MISLNIREGDENEYEVDDEILTLSKWCFFSVKLEGRRQSGRQEKKDKKYFKKATMTGFIVLHCVIIDPHHLTVQVAQKGNFCCRNKRTHHDLQTELFSGKKKRFLKRICKKCKTAK